MEKFNDIIWDRYQALKYKVSWLERRYFSLLFILIIQTFTYGFIYFNHFK